MLRPLNKAEVSFDIIKEIGFEGKNSKVYLGKDNNLDADIVIKEICKSKFPHRDDYFKEAQRLYASKHAYVVPVQYACEDAANVYLALPYFKNGSLNQVINAKFLTVKEIVRYGTQYLSGLHHIHSKKLIHFDIKPDNILISDRNEAMVSDFGLAKHTDWLGLAGQDRMYFKQRPPESLDTDVFSVAFDIYQAGITLYRMANGNEVFYYQFNKYGSTPTTFDRDSFKHDVKNGKFPDRKFFHAHIPTKLQNIIKKCLDIDPSKRYKAALDVANDLALIDGPEIDWHYSNTGGEKRWVKDGDDKKYELVVTTDNKSVATKSRGTGAARKIKDYCLESVTEKDIKSFLRSY